MATLVRHPLSEISPQEPGTIKVNGQTEWEIWGRLEAGETVPVIAEALGMSSPNVMAVAKQMADLARANLREAQTAALTISARRLHHLYGKMQAIVDDEMKDDSVRISAAKMCLGAIAAQASLYKLGDSKGMGASVARFESMSDAEVEAFAENAGLRVLREGRYHNTPVGIDHAFKDKS